MEFQLNPIFAGTQWDILNSDFLLEKTQIIFLAYVAIGSFTCLLACFACLFASFLPYIGYKLREVAFRSGRRGEEGEKETELGREGQFWQIHWILNICAVSSGATWTLLILCQL